MTTIHDIDPGLGSIGPDAEARDATNFRRVRAAKKAENAATEALVDAVRAARSSGDSWSVIAVALGTSKQAAQQRFGKIVEA